MFFLLRASLYQPLAVTANAAGVRLWVLSVRRQWQKLQGRVDHLIRVPQTIPALLPVLTTVPLQLLAYHMAVLRGADVDQPRNLAKSVTVE